MRVVRADHNRQPANPRLSLAGISVAFTSILLVAGRFKTIQRVVDVGAEEQTSVRCDGGGAGSRGEAAALPEDFPGIQVACVQAARADGV